MVMMKPAFSYGVRDIFIASDPKLENWRCMFTEKSEWTILLWLTGSASLGLWLFLISITYFDSSSSRWQLTHLCNQGRFPRLRSSRLSPLSEYKSNQSNLTNCYVYCREIIKQCVNAGKDDVVVFTGSGTTGAIHKLIHALQLTGKVVEKSVSTRNWIFSTTSRSLKILTSEIMIWRALTIFWCFFKTFRLMGLKPSSVEIVSVKPLSHYVSSWLPLLYFLTLKILVGSFYVGSLMVIVKRGGLMVNALSSSSGSSGPVQAMPVDIVLSLEQDTLLSQCLSAPSCIFNNYSTSARWIWDDR